MTIRFVVGAARSLVGEDELIQDGAGDGQRKPVTNANGLPPNFAEEWAMVVSKLPRIKALAEHFQLLEHELTGKELPADHPANWTEYEAPEASEPQPEPTANAWQERLSAPVPRHDIAAEAVVRESLQANISGDWEWEKWQDAKVKDMKDPKPTKPTETWRVENYRPYQAPTQSEWEEAQALKGNASEWEPYNHPADRN